MVSIQASAIVFRGDDRFHACKPLLLERMILGIVFLSKKSVDVLRI